MTIVQSPKCNKTIADLSIFLKSWSRHNSSQAKFLYLYKEYEQLSKKKKPLKIRKLGKSPWPFGMPLTLNHKSNPTFNSPKPKENKSMPNLLTYVDFYWFYDRGVATNGLRRGFWGQKLPKRGRGFEGVDMLPNVVLLRFWWNWLMGGFWPQIPHWLCPCFMTLMFSHQSAAWKLPIYQYFSRFETDIMVTLGDMWAHFEATLNIHL